MGLAARICQWPQSSSPPQLLQPAFVASSSTLLMIHPQDKPRLQYASDLHLDCLLATYSWCHSLCCVVIQECSLSEISGFSVSLRSCAESARKHSIASGWHSYSE